MAGNKEEKKEERKEEEGERDKNDYLRPIRHAISIGTIATFLWLVVYAVTVNPILFENPLVTLVLGAFGPMVMLVYNFYFRKSHIPEKGSCHPCGRKNNICNVCGNRMI